MSRPASTIRPLEILTPIQRGDLERMATILSRRMDELRDAPTETKRREAGEHLLRAAADIYSWSH